MPKHFIFKERGLHPQHDVDLLDLGFDVVDAITLQDRRIGHFYCHLVNKQLWKVSLFTDSLAFSIHKGETQLCYQEVHFDTTLAQFLALHGHEPAQRYCRRYKIGKLLGS